MLADFYRLPAYSCGQSHHSKQFYYSICDFVLVELGLSTHSFCCAHISPWQRVCCILFPPGTSEVPVPAPGVQGPEVVADLLASVCTCFFTPSLLENGSNDSFLKWSFLFSNPSHPERESCLQGSGVTEISPFAPCALVEGG